MQKEQFPCYRCLKLPICRHLLIVECSDLFFIILDNADFDSEDKIINEDIKICLKTLLINVERILPGFDWKERLNYEDTLLDMHSISSLRSKKTN
jgi:hypothetical protein